MAVKNILQESFYLQPAEIVARELLGMNLVVRRNEKSESYRITETEAYLGEIDKASHAYKGRTKRTEVMYGKGGFWYVYLIYGVYDMLNVVVGDEGVPEAVLIRGVEGLTGPGKLTKALSITREINAQKIKEQTGVWIEPAISPDPFTVSITPRIGIDYAEDWRDKPLRFVAV